MDQFEYYEAVYDRLEACFEPDGWVLGYGPELIRYGWDPSKLLVTVEPASELHRLACEWGLEVFVPIFGRGGRSVLMPFDFEISLTDENYKLYADALTQKHYFDKYINPVMDCIEGFLKFHGVPYLLDLTPSGGHFLFRVHEASPSYRALAAIGHLEPELALAYDYTDHTDLKRNPAAGFVPGSVFSGIGRLAEYIAFVIMAKLKHLNFPISISDTHPKSVNLDLTWASDPGFMRIIRSPFSLHKKNIHKFHMSDRPLADVARSCFCEDGSYFRVGDTDRLVECMWNLETAAAHATAFPCGIPFANDNLVHIIKDHYMNSSVFEFHRYFDAEPNLRPGEARHRALSDRKISEKTRDVFAHPYPRLLEPASIQKFVHDLLANAGWHPKHIGNLINDFYSRSDIDWHTNWFKYVPRTRAHFYARVYSFLLLVELGRLKVDVPDERQFSLSV